jgi:hypothetical protein
VRAARDAALRVGIYSLFERGNWMAVRPCAVTLTALGCCISSQSSWGHHPVAANYDSSKPVQLRGMAAKILFAAPHSYLWLDVRETSGEFTHWVVELDNTAKVGTAGLTKRTAAPGMIMTITTYPAKAGASLVDAIPSAPREVHEAAKAGWLVHGTELQLPDGQTIVVGDK